MPINLIDLAYPTVSQALVRNRVSSSSQLSHTGLNLFSCIIFFSIRGHIGQQLHQVMCIVVEFKFWWKIDWIDPMDWDRLSLWLWVQYIYAFLYHLPEGLLLVRAVPWLCRLGRWLQHSALKKWCPDVVFRLASSYQDTDNLMILFSLTHYHLSRLEYRSRVGIPSPLRASEAQSGGSC